ncbi:MAG TPA: redoxin domain-containing protein [Planctomycetaceae bacterium]|jgi:peroxiredoxin|nr:redoxin domain-containing protein [Planctomycetaceae bacterium]
MTATGSSWLVLGLLLAASPNAASPIGKQIDAVVLKDSLGTSHSLDDWKDRRAIVVLFLGTDCPLARQYGSLLAQLAETYKAKGVQFVGIDPNQQDSLAAINHYVQIHKLPFPILKDLGNVVADKFQAVRTPEAFVLDDRRVVRYRGRIDDRFGVGYVRGRVSNTYLADALEDVLAGRPVRKPEVEAVGCRIGRLSHNPPKGSVTYTNQIARILQAHCVKCHRAGEIAPFTLTSYEDAKSWAETMREAIESLRMPPWSADPHYGEFTNDARLSDEEKRLIAEWIDNGVPEGDRSQLPPPPRFTEGWQIPKPDLVVKMPKPFTVPATGVVEYKYFLVDPHFKTDMWVKAAEGRPGNRSVVHHMALFFLPPGRKDLDPADAQGNLLVSSVPGIPELISREGYARRIPAGATLVFQMHYTPNGTQQTDQSECGFVFADPKTVKRELLVGTIVNFEFLIPPGAADYQVEGSDKFDQDMLLFSLMPHMHLRGKSFRFLAVNPDGHKEILLDVPRYDFNWQNNYELARPRPMKAGSRLAVVAQFDNSANNLSNPDPTKSVHWGDQTFDEMMIGLYYYGMAEQNLTFGPPRIMKTRDGQYAAAFRYRPTIPAKAVYLAGTFNKWKPAEIAMPGPDRDGWYRTTLPLKAGRYEYKFVVDGKVWRPDPGNAVRAGEYGNSVLVVGAASPSQVSEITRPAAAH